MSLRGAARKFVLPNAPLSVTALARKELCLTSSVSVRDLMRRLQPEIATFRSGSISATTVRGQAVLGVSSDGFCSFRGHVHENGVVSHDYSFGAVFQFVDPDGTVYACVNSGSVHGALSLGSRDDDWQEDRRDCRISANWDSIKRSPVRFGLKVDLNELDLILDIAGALFPVVPPHIVVITTAKDNVKALCKGEAGEMDCISGAPS